MKFNATLLVSLILNATMFSCYKEEEVPVIMDFEYIQPESYTVPVDLALVNRTSGADFYRWTFEGASPATSDDKNPGTISYDKAGTYTIKLEAWNDTQRNTKEITFTLDSAVNLAFDVAVQVNDFVPATVKITNQTRGASSYEWTFEGGTPATSTLANPPDVLFDSPGEHAIQLRVGNGREFFSSSKTIVLKPAMVIDFSIIPSFEDEDYEAPLTANLQNGTISALRNVWSATGGVINNTTAENTAIYFENPGTYTVTLQTENDKDVQTTQRTITVKPNTNLYIMEDVKLAISAGHVASGSFYSTKLRQVLKREDVNADNGSLIDIVFFGINSSFSYSRFISPDSAAKYAFPPIPGASHTAFINTLESSAISFSGSQFDAMTNDTPLQPLDIKNNDSKISFFNSTVAPRIVLFETSDGRKGAIKVKSFVVDGSQSYILLDIKVQKLKR
jgi:PKD repeat protein